MIVGAILGLLALTACGGGGPPSPSGIFVDPANGLDTNPGSKADPLKTIGKALTVADSGDEVVLMAGTYDEISGENWAYTVPTGITLKGNTSGIVLQSNSNANAFTFAGDATLTGLTLKGFGQALVASGGNLTLTNDTFEGNNVGVTLTGIAKASLTTVSFTGSGGGLDLQDASSATMTGGSVDGLDGDAFDLSGSADLALTSVSVTLTRSYVLSMRDASTASLTGCTINDSSPQGAGGSSSIDISGSAAVTVTGTNISNAYGYAILGRTSGTHIAITGGNVSGNGYGGINAAGTLTVDGGSFTGNDTAGILVSGSAVVRDATISYNTGRGITAGAGASLKLRGTALEENSSGAVSLTGASGSADLGTAADPGGNTFRQSSVGVTGLDVDWTNAAVQAVGNTWLPTTQGADASGDYGPQLVVGPASGANFTLVAGASLQF